jgi:uncharacterized protein (UPF0332 family)
MSSTTMVMRLFAAAKTLLEERPQSSAYRRRAVSTAYYALFHSLAKVCAETLLPGSRRNSAEFERIYRALDHGPLKNAFGQSPIKDDPALKKIGEAFITLQSERHRADYMPPEAKMFALSECKRLIDLASQAADQIDALNEEQRRTLSTFAIFKNRPT